MLLLAFIINNTINDLLLTCNEQSDVVVTNNHNKLKSLLMLITGLLGIVGATFLASFFFFLLIEREFVLNRNRFTEILVRLDSTEIEKRLVQVEKFSSMVNTNTADRKHIETEMREGSAKRRQVKDKESFNLYNKRIANRRDINTSIIKITVIALGLLLLVMSGYFVLLMTVKTQNAEIISKSSLLLNSNNNLYQLAFLYFSTFQYVETNTTGTIHGELIGNEWENASARLLGLGEVFSQLLDPVHGLGGDPDLIKLTKGNLCEVLYPDNPQSVAICAAILYGLPQKGLLALNGFMIALASRTKLEFDNSGRTLKDMYVALNSQDMAQAEIVWYIYMFPSYQKVDSLIRARLGIDLEKYSRLIMTIACVYAILYITVGIAIWIKIKTSFEREQMKWQRMIRLIPNTIMKSNKMLGAFLRANNHSLVRSSNT